MNLLACLLFKGAQANYKALGYELHRFLMLFAPPPEESRQYWNPQREQI
jgi:hypothetical protein